MSLAVTQHKTIDEVIDEAADWLRSDKARMKMYTLSSFLRRKFHLSAFEAWEAIARTDDQIDAAAAWLIATPHALYQQNVVDHLKTSFGIETREAFHAIKIASMRSLASYTPAADVASEEILSRLFGYGVDSEDRLDVILHFLQEADKEVARAVFSETWSSCDDTWNNTCPLIDLLFSLQGEEYEEQQWWRRFADEETLTWFDGLPERITVYRGCGEGREAGVSWTTWSAPRFDRTGGVSRKAQGYP